jgi:hypothetical protein
MRKKANVLALLGFGLLLGYMIYSSMLTEVSCEVCIEFQGRTECRSAGGTTPEEAQRSATDLACTFLGNGMTESIACSNTPPTKLMCVER